MALARSPLMTRSQTAAAAAAETDCSEEERTLACSATTDSARLRAALQELQELRKEREKERGELLELRQRAQERQRETQQLSRSPLRGRGDESGSVNIGNIRVNDRREILGYKLKPDNFDGTTFLREFLLQFELISRANGWDDENKAIVLASCLRGRARSVLENVENLDRINFTEIKTKLELRFGVGQSSQVYYSQFVNRRQFGDEDFATFGSELDRLSRLAYSECSREVCDKIACSQFVVGIVDNFVRRTLQLEGVTSLWAAVERANVLKTIQGNCFPREDSSNSGNVIERGKYRGIERGNNKGKIECWNCGKKGHYRSECLKNVSTECWTCGAKDHIKAECPAGKPHLN